jgi:C1A family cysteine protease
MISVTLVYAQTVKEVNTQIAKEGLLWTAGETSVSQMSPDQQRALLGGLPTPLEEIDPAQIWEPPDDKSLGGLPVSYDLRDLNLVSPIKDQANCGSCWAFSSTANLESLSLQAGGSSSFSEQAMLDCSEGTCTGWYLDTAFDFLKNYGTTLQNLYPYTGVKGTCQAYPPVARVQSWQWINPTGLPTRISNNMIKSWIYTYRKPVSCRMEVYPSFYYYQKGVYHHLRREQSEGGHFVLIVGWGRSRGINYWIVKNSWGPDWGQDGFFFIRMNDSYIGTYAIGAEIE